MKKNKIIYWVATAIISGMMLFSATLYLTSPQIKMAFVHLGYPDYFRIELAVAKIAGVIILLVPQIPARVKEWAYAGFGITFISAAIAHTAVSDGVQAVITTIFFLMLLVVSNIYFNKIFKTQKAIL